MMLDPQIQSKFFECSIVKLLPIISDNCIRNSKSAYNVSLDEVGYFLFSYGC